MFCRPQWMEDSFFDHRPSISSRASPFNPLPLSPCSSPVNSSSLSFEQNEFVEEDRRRKSFFSAKICQVKRRNPRRRGIRHRIDRFPLPSSSLDPREDIVVLRSAQRLEEEWPTRLRQSNSSSNSNVPLERQQRKISLNQRRSSPAGQAIQISIGPIPFKWKRRRKDRQTNSSRADARTLTIISVAKGKDISPKSLHRRHTETVAREFNGHSTTDSNATNRW